MITFYVTRNDTTADAFRTLLATADRFILQLPPELCQGPTPDRAIGPALLREEANRQLANYRREIEADGLWDRALLLTVVTDYFTACPPQTEERHILADWAREQYAIRPETIEDAEFLTVADKPLIDHHRRAYAWWAEQSEWQPLRAPFAARGNQLAERLQEVENASREKPWIMPNWIAIRRGVVSKPGEGAPMEWATLDLSADYKPHFQEGANRLRVRIEQWPFTFNPYVTDYTGSLLGWATVPPSGEPGNRTRADLRPTLNRLDTALFRVNECLQKIPTTGLGDMLHHCLNELVTELTNNKARYKEEFECAPEAAPLVLTDSPTPTQVTAPPATDTTPEQRPNAEQAPPTPLPVAVEDAPAPAPPPTLDDLLLAPLTSQRLRLFAEEIKMTSAACPAKPYEWAALWEALHKDVLRVTIKEEVAADVLKQELGARISRSTLENWKGESSGKSKSYKAAFNRLNAALLLFVEKLREDEHANG
jgi:hypothetical protein